MARTERRLGLGLVLVSLTATLGLGFLLKTQPVIRGGHLVSPCAQGDWADGKQYRHLCYSDIVPLYGAEQLAGNRLPYLDACAPSPGNCDEYPVLTMYAMRVGAWMSSGIAGFFYANAILLGIAAFAIAIALYLAAGTRTLMFALAPTLLIYGFMNWDLIAVALATLATLAYLRRRDIWAGALLGLGAAAKLYPALLVVPLALGRFREKDPDGGIHLTWAAAAAWLVTNLPFALRSPSSWWEFFRFNSTRPADWDSLWFVACHRLVSHQPFCGATAFVNVASLLLFAGGSALLWHLRRGRVRDFPGWTFGFPMLVAFLLTNKVYSPQYGLWLLPWFVLALPDLRPFVAFQLADVAVFVTRFSWFGRYSGFGGLPLGAFEVAVLVRAAVLVWCLVAWVRRPADALPATARAGSVQAVVAA